MMAKKSVEYLAVKTVEKKVEKSGLMLAAKLVGLKAALTDVN